MSDQTYNGWRNYPTWAVHLWLTNDQGSDELCREMAQEIADTPMPHPRYEMSQRLKSLVRDEEPGDADLFGDLLGYALDCVDWYEIADAFLDEVEVTEEVEA